MTDRALEPSTRPPPHSAASARDDADDARGEEARAAVTESLERLGLAQTELGPADTTIPRRADPISGVLSDLPTIAIERPELEGEPAVASPDFVLRDVLGRGGMGVVHLAQQRSLGRDVAVKTSRLNDPTATRALVREARITGGLEHPSVVPVHALGVDRDGAPLLVMKRVEGVSWRTLIHDDAHEAWKPLLAGHGDRLRGHVEILAQVCRALEFAHDRGVVHRDLKPANVMIGRFGEVYLLDWGVALRLDERADEPAALVGTPGYIAPEMVRGAPGLVGPHTDVYLLGATLYEVLARRAPHDAPNALTALVAAFVGKEPPLPDDAPRELASLIRRAMAIDPGARIASAGAFREELARFLVSREAELVRAEGRAALRRAQEVIAAHGPGAPDAFRALIEARFALASTARARDDHESRAELDLCLRSLVEREIALRSPGGARAVLAEMSAVPRELEARIAALEAEIDAERAAAEERERALREGDSSRSLTAMTATVSAIVALMVIAYGAVISRGGTEDLDAYAALTIWTGALIGFGVVAFLARRQILTNAATRTMGAFLGVVLLTPFVTTLAALAVGAPMYQRSIYSWIASAGLAALGELKFLPQVWPCAVVYLVGVAVVLAEPGWAFRVQPIVILSTALILVRALRRHAAMSRVDASGGRAATGTAARRSSHDA